MRFARLASAAAAIFALAGSCTKDTNLAGAAVVQAGRDRSTGLETRVAQDELARSATPELRALLDDRSAEVRARAALALGRIGDAESTLALGVLLARDGADGANAAWALGRIRPAKSADAAAAGENPAAPNGSASSTGSPSSAGSGSAMQGAAQLSSLAKDARAASSAAPPIDAESLLVDCVRTLCPQAAASARALGGGTRSAETLASLAAALAAPESVAAQAGIALGVLTRTGEKGADVKVAEAARARLWSALARPESSVRRGAAYALGRIPRAVSPAAAEKSGAAIGEKNSAASAEKSAAASGGKNRAAAPAEVPLQLSSAQSAALTAALHDPDPETRSLAARAAGKQGAPAQELAGLLTDADWRVRVEAARALALAPGGAELLVPAIRAAAAQLSSAKKISEARWAHPLAELFGSAAHLKLARDALPAPETLSGPSAASTIAVRCADAEARDRAADALLETPACSAGLEPSWRARFRTATLAAELAGDHPESAAGKIAVAALNDTDPRVRSAAAGSVSLAFAAQLIERLGDPDPYVVASAAGALANDSAISRAALPDAARAALRFSDARSSPTGNPRTDALAALADLFAAALAFPAPEANSPAASSAAANPAGAPAPRPLPPELLALRPIFSLDPNPPLSLPLFHSLLDLQKLLTPEGAPRAVTPVTLRPPPLQVPAASEPGRPGKGPRLHTLLLTTTTGDLRVRLFTGDDETPLTSAALATLANQGFYDGLLWHRVVPDFVAQGGDPLGDGEGGPGWSLPDEHTPSPFLRGSLGIATSGPETGGSQIFLCHSPQPHLDGRYTVAGILDGSDASLEAMDALQVADQILRARAE